MHCPVLLEIHPVSGKRADAEGNVTEVEAAGATILPYPHHVANIPHLVLVSKSMKRFFVCLSQSPARQGPFTQKTSIHVLGHVLLSEGLRNVPWVKTND